MIGMLTMPSAMRSAPLMAPKASKRATPLCFRSTERLEHSLANLDLIQEKAARTFDAVLLTEDDHQFLVCWQPLPQPRAGDVDRITLEFDTFDVFDRR
jgi:hypothetical protein